VKRNEQTEGGSMFGLAANHRTWEGTVIGIPEHDSWKSQNPKKDPKWVGSPKIPDYIDKYDKEGLSSYQPYNNDNLWKKINYPPIFKAPKKWSNKQYPPDLVDEMWGNPVDK
tara:strand:+ start:143 stop:478 length:336 start_codon:yes stop_codon:yes gene_type:complete